MDSDFDSQYRDAVDKSVSEQPRAAAVRYNVRSKRIDVELTSGMALSVPAAHIEGLHAATIAQLKEGRVRGHGTALRWDSIDVDVSVPALFRGALGTRQWMAELGRAGGKSTSERKARASRENGAKGGRPQVKSSKD